MGSGTTLFVANRMRRNSIGIEIVPKYYEIVKSQLNPVTLSFPEHTLHYEKTEYKRRIAVR